MLSLLACGLSTNIYTLIAFRTVGGLSWAGCGPAGFAIMAEGVAASKRGIVGTWQMMTGTFGGSIGTVAGGLVITLMGWRYCFLLVSAPVAIVWLLSFCVLPKDKDMSREELLIKLWKFDKLGTLTFIVCSGAALLVINRGNDLGWDSPVVLGSGAVALITLPIVIMVERRAEQPILPFSLLWADPIAMKCCVLTAGTWCSFNGTYLVLPIFLQMGQGWTPGEAGAVLFCRPLGGFVVSNLIRCYMCVITAWPCSDTAGKI